jgi:hypothetical protein
MPDRPLVLVTDSGFSALEFLAALLRQEITCVTRLRLDAALYQPPPPRRPGTVGRPRTKGARLPSLIEVLADKTTRGQRVTVPGWYGEGDRVVEICSDTAVWRHAGLPVVPIRWAEPPKVPRAWRAEWRRRGCGATPASASTRSPALHRHRPGASADRSLVRPALAAGGHLPRSTTNMPASLGARTAKASGRRKLTRRRAQPPGQIVRVSAPPASAAVLALVTVESGPCWRGRRRWRRPGSARRCPPGGSTPWLTGRGSFRGIPRPARSLVLQTRLTSLLGGRCSRLKLIEQRLGLDQVRRVEAFGEPAIDWGEKIVGLGGSSLVAPESGEAGAGAELE